MVYVVPEWLCQWPQLCDTDDDSDSEEGLKYEDTHTTAAFPALNNDQKVFASPWG